MVEPGLTTSGTKLHPEKILRGERIGNAVLTEVVVAAIKRAHNAGVRQNAIADATGVSKSQVNRIVLGRTWGHVRPEAPK